MKILERKLAKKYDKNCHDYKTNRGYTVWLKEPFEYGDEVSPEDLEFMSDDMKILGFYTWKGQIYSTDGCGDAWIQDILSEEELRRFLNYISNENNLKFEH